MSFPALGGQRRPPLRMFIIQQSHPDTLYGNIRKAKADGGTVWVLDVGFVWYNKARDIACGAGRKNKQTPKASR